MNCPFCAERIKPAALVCRFCGKDIPVTAETETNPSREVNRQKNSNFLKRAAERFFALSRLAKITTTVLASVSLLCVVSFGGYTFFEVQEQNRIIAEQKKAEDQAAAELEALLEEQKRAEADNSWVPLGYSKFPLNPYMAFRKDSSQKCGTYGVCYPFVLVTSKFCDSVYIAGNIVSDGTVLDFSNDSAQGILPGQKVKMKLQYTVENVAGTVQFTDATCR